MFIFFCVLLGLASVLHTLYGLYIKSYFSILLETRWATPQVRLTQDTMNTVMDAALVAAAAKKKAVRYVVFQYLLGSNTCYI